MSSPLVPANPFITLNGAAVDGSTFAKGFSVSVAANIIEANYADQSAVARNFGLTNYTAGLNIDAETTTHEVSAGCWALVGAAAGAAVFRPDDAVIGATNPEWTGSVGVASVSLTFNQNEAASADVELFVDGTLARAIA